MKVHKIYVEILESPVYGDDSEWVGSLSFSQSGVSRLATEEEYRESDRCVGSIFEALEEGDFIELFDGIYRLNKKLDLVKIEL